MLKCSDQNCGEIVSRKFSAVLVWRDDEKGGEGGEGEGDGCSVEDPTLRQWQCWCEKKDTN